MSELTRENESGLLHKKGFPNSWASSEASFSGISKSFSLTSLGVDAAQLTGLILLFWTSDALTLSFSALFPQENIQANFAFVLVSALVRIINQQFGISLTLTGCLMLYKIPQVVKMWNLNAIYRRVKPISHFNESRVLKLSNDM